MYVKGKIITQQVSHLFFFAGGQKTFPLPYCSTAVLQWLPYFECTVITVKGALHAVPHYATKYSAPGTVL